MHCCIFDFRRKSGESRGENKNNPREPVVILEPVVIQDSPDPIIISDSPAAKPIAPSGKRPVALSEAKLPSTLTQQSTNRNSGNKFSGGIKLASSSRTKLSSSSSGKSKTPYCKGSNRVDSAEERSSTSKAEPEPGVAASRCDFDGVFAKFKSGRIIGNKAQLSNGEVKESPCSDNDKKSFSKCTLRVGNDNSCDESVIVLSESTEISDVENDFESCNDGLKDLPVKSKTHKDGSSADNAIDLSESNVDSDCVGYPSEAHEKVSSQCVA